MRITVFEIIQGEKRYASHKAEAAADRLDTSASSSAWTVEEGNTVTISGTPTLSGSTAQAFLIADANRTGCTLIKNVITMADAQTVTALYKINVIDPTC